MKRDEWARETAAQLRQAHKAELKRWPQLDLEIWLRDDCRCVYCFRDMLQDFIITYHAYCYEHLLPEERYKDLATVSWNKVLACRDCNARKGRFDPAGSDIPPTVESRDRLVERVRDYIRPSRIRDEALYLQEREVLRSALMLWKSG